MSESFPSRSSESSSSSSSKSSGESTPKIEGTAQQPHIEQARDTGRPQDTRPSIDGIASMAMREQREQLAAQHDREEKGEKAAKDTGKTSDTKVPVQLQEADQGDGQAQPKRESIVAILAGDSSKGSATESAENVEPHREDTSVEEDKNESHEIVEVSDKPLPQVAPAEQLEQPQPFEDFVGEHPELADLRDEAEEVAPSIDKSIPELPEPDTFTEAIRQNMSPDFISATSGEVLAHQNEFDEFIDGHPELDPSEAEVEYADENEAEVPDFDNGNLPPTPPTPPTAEGLGGEDDEPEPGRFGSAEPPDPELLRDPWMPVGDALSPAAVGSMSALEARQRMDSLRHTTREAGLAGAIGILGLGLVLEHFIAKRRDKKQQKQINRQGKEIAATNRMFEQEQVRHSVEQEQTRRQIETINTTHARTTEDLKRHIREQIIPARKSRSEVALGGGLIGDTVARELAAKVARKRPDGQLMTIEDQVLQEQIISDPEAVRVIARDRDIQRANEAVTSARRADIERELRHERPKDKSTIDVNYPSFTDRGTALPAPNSSTAQQIDTRQFATELANATKKQEITSKHGRSWTWFILGLILLALLAGALSA